VKSLKKTNAATLLLTVLALTAISILPVKAPSNIAVLSHQSHLSSSGIYYIVGEAQNIGSQPQEYVKITATFYNLNGTMIGADYTYAELDVIYSGSKSPFLISYAETTQIPQIDHYTLSASSLTAASRPANLKILSHNSYVNSGYLHVIGEIQNMGTILTKYVKIVATFYDQTGEVVGTDYTYSDPSDIASGQKAPFELTLIEKANETMVASYAITAESIEYSLQGRVLLAPISTQASTPTQAPTATPYFSHNPTPSPTIPEFSQTIILVVAATLLILTLGLVAYRRRNFS
jgi:hypothetical protein